jgi:hypothetical protein
VLNLVKSTEKQPRESILRAELANAIAYINKGVRIWQSGDAAFLKCTQAALRNWGRQLPFGLKEVIQE